MKCLFVSHPVAPLGTGLGGWVELTLRNVVQALDRRGHQVDVIAPAGSSLGAYPVIEKAPVDDPKWTEAFGNVAIEALACGVPVLAYRRGGPAEMIENGRTGWLSSLTTLMA